VLLCTLQCTCPLRNFCSFIQSCSRYAHLVHDGFPLFLQFLLERRGLPLLLSPWLGLSSRYTAFSPRGLRRTVVFRPAKALTFQIRRWPDCHIASSRKGNLPRRTPPLVLLRSPLVPRFEPCLAVLSPAPSAGVFFCLAPPRGPGRPLHF